MIELSPTRISGPDDSLAPTGKSSSLSSKSKAEAGMVVAYEDSELLSVFHRGSRDTAAPEVMMNVLVGLQVDISIDWGTTGGQYQVVGPATALDQLSCSNCLGLVSSMSGVTTMCLEVREIMGIPETATQYAYLHPIICESTSVTRVMSLSFRKNRWANLLLFGGFAFFNEAQELLQINAFSYASSDGVHGLGLVRHNLNPELKQRMRAKLEESGAFSQCQDFMMDNGFHRVAWVHGGERLAGEVLAPKAGAFFFETDPARGDDGLMVYILVPVTAEQIESNRERIEQLDLAALPEELQGTLIAAMAQPIRSLIKARNAEVEACKTIVAASKKYTHGSGTWREFFERLKTVLVFLVVLALYIGLGVLFYTQKEELSFGEAFYFSVVTISTVGYGDITPSDSESRLFTAFYMLFGIAVVFGLAGEIYAFVFDEVIYNLELMYSKTRECCGLGSMNDGIIIKQDSVQVKPLWRHWVSGLWAPVLIGGTVSAIIPAVVFTETQYMSIEDALWHSLTTTTTVGYGDVALTTSASLYFAGFQIVLSTSWLVWMFSRVQEVHEERKLVLLRKAALDAQLDKGFMHKLNLSANPNGVGMVDFLAGMLILLGTEVGGEPLDYKTHIVPLMRRFERLGETSDGYLTKEDIDLLVDTANAARANKQLTMSQI